MDYAMKKGVSLSTLRRHIKTNKVQYKVEDGRYLLFVTESFKKGDLPPAGNIREEALRNDNHQSSSGEVRNLKNPNTSNDASSAALTQKVRKLETELHRAQEEIAEMKMLIALYEEKISGPRFNN
ncbi:MAG: hypothetical protein H7222_10495 [Methylotenera sp.]|nr:hypothetical protein [Oligoflexia bacterium]